MSVFKFDKDTAKFYSQFSPEKMITKWVDLPQMFLKLFKKVAACVLSGLKHCY